MTPSEQLTQFVEQVRFLQSVNFPQVASTLKPPLSWFKDIRPHLRTNAQFLEGMEEALEEIKYALIQKLLQVGRDGKKFQGPSPEPAHIKAIIQMIDSGALLGLSKRASGEGSVSPEAERERLSRLGYSDEDIDKIASG